MSSKTTSTFVPAPREARVADGERWPGLAQRSDASGRPRVSKMPRGSRAAPAGTKPAQRAAAPGHSVATALMGQPRSAPVAGTGGGKALPQGVRQKMEGSLGMDFSAVRVHEGPQAKAMGALAYTQGTDVHFAPGQYRPHSQAGQELLGHELAHVRQQAEGRVRATRQMKGMGLNDDMALEREADMAGRRAARGHGGPRPVTLGPTMPSQATVQRAPEPVTFTATSFTPGSDGALQTSDEDVGFLWVASSDYESQATVGVAGGDDTEAAKWDVGYIQTVLSSVRLGHYIGSPTQKTRIDSVPNNTRDGHRDSTAPWYSQAGSAREPKAFTATDTSKNVSLWDRPSSNFNWTTEDGKGKLIEASGKDRFATWLIARNRSAADPDSTIVFIKWETWEVNYAARSNLFLRGSKTVGRVEGSTKKTGHGDGKGTHTPTLTGQVANSQESFRWSNQDMEPIT